LRGCCSKSKAAVAGGEQCASELIFGERVLAGGEHHAGYLNSGERMLAGGGCVVGGRTPAKPQGSEVIVFWEDFLRRETVSPELL